MSEDRKLVKKAKLVALGLDSKQPTIVVTYELIVQDVSSGKPVTVQTERKQQNIKLAAFKATSPINKFAEQIVAKCKYIPSSKQNLVERLLNRLKARLEGKTESGSAAKPEGKSTSGGQQPAESSGSSGSSKPVKSSASKKSSTKSSSTSSTKPSSKSTGSSRKNSQGGEPSRQSGKDSSSKASKTDSSKATSRESTGSSKSTSREAKEVVTPSVPRKLVLPASLDEDLLQDEEASLVGNEPLSLSQLNSYMECLYDETSSGKVKGVLKILQLVQDAWNLEEFMKEPSVMGALARVLNDERRRSTQLTCAILQVFFCISCFTEFQEAILGYELDVIALKVVDLEVRRFDHRMKINHALDFVPENASDTALTLDSGRGDNASTASTDGGSASDGSGGHRSSSSSAGDRTGTLSKLREKKGGPDLLKYIAGLGQQLLGSKKLSGESLQKQEKLLFVSFYLLLNLSQNIHVELRMKSQNLIPLLSASLLRRNPVSRLVLDRLWYLTLTFLKKLSIYQENKPDLLTSHVVSRVRCVCEMAMGVACSQTPLLPPITPDAPVHPEVFRALQMLEARFMTFLKNEPRSGRGDANHSLTRSSRRSRRQKSSSSSPGFVNNELLTAVLRLLFNLSCDQELRAEMLGEGIHFLCVLMLRSPHLRHAALKILYSLSSDDRFRPHVVLGFLIPGCQNIGLVAKVVAHFPEKLLSAELAALLVNITLKASPNLLEEGSPEEDVFNKRSIIRDKSGKVQEDEKEAASSPERKTNVSGDSSRKKSKGRKNRKKKGSRSKRDQSSKSRRRERLRGQRDKSSAGSESDLSEPDEVTRRQRAAERRAKRKKKLQALKQKRREQRKRPSGLTTEQTVSVLVYHLSADKYINALVKRLKETHDILLARVLRNIVEHYEARGVVLSEANRVYLSPSDKLTRGGVELPGAEQKSSVLDSPGDRLNSPQVTPLGPLGARKLPVGSKLHFGGLKCFQKNLATLVRICMNSRDEDLTVELLGLLASLPPRRVSFLAVLQTCNLVPYLVGLMAADVADDAFLSVVMLIGVIAANEETMPFLQDARLIDCLAMGLMRKTGEVEVILQSTFTTLQLLMYPETRKLVLAHGSYVDALLNVVVDPHPDVRYLVNVCLDICMENDHDWGAKIRQVRFESCNRVWLTFMQQQQQQGVPHSPMDQEQAYFAQAGQPQTDPYSYGNYADHGTPYGNPELYAGMHLEGKSPLAHSPEQIGPDGRPIAVDGVMDAGMHGRYASGANEAVLGMDEFYSDEEPLPESVVHTNYQMVDDEQDGVAAGAFASDAIGGDPESYSRYNSMLNEEGPQPTNQQGAQYGYAY